MYKRGILIKTKFLPKTKRVMAKLGVSTTAVDFDFNKDPELSHAKAARAILKQTNKRLFGGFKIFACARENEGYFFFVFKENKD